MSKKYTDELIATVISEYSDGKSINQLSNAYDICYDVILRWLKKNNVPNNKTARFYQEYEVDGETTLIWLKHRGGFVKTFIDTEDVERCREVGIWTYMVNGYVANCKTGVYLHRFIMDAKHGTEVDHINHNPLDNRKCNLRFATSREQKFNTKLRSDNTSGERGIYYDKSRNTWNVSLKSGEISVKRRFKDKKSAIEYRNQCIVRMQGEFRYGSCSENG